MHELFKRALTVKAFDESKVERWEKGDSRGGQFAPKNGQAEQSSAAAVRTKKKPRVGPPPEKPPKAPRQPKPSPLVERLRAQKASQQSSSPSPAPKTAAAVTAQASPRTATDLTHTARPESFETSKLSDQARLTIKAQAANMSPAEASKLALQYEKFAAQMWNASPVKKADYEQDPKSQIIKRLDGSDKNHLRKAIEFDRKAALWAHFAENPDDAKKPTDVSIDEDIPFDDLVEPSESSADIGSSYAPEDWSELDARTQKKTEQEWIDNRITDDDFLDWAYDSIDEGIDDHDLIEQQFDSLVDEIPWSKFDVSQNKIADEIEETVKAAAKSGMPVGGKMSDADTASWKEHLLTASENWADGELSDEDRQALAEATVEALKLSADGEINTLHEDEVADAIRIDRDEGVRQLTAAFDDGEKWAEDIVRPLRQQEITSRLEDEDYLKEYAQIEWDGKENEERIDAARGLGIVRSPYDDSPDRTNDYLRGLGIEDAATFVGAPDDCTVTLEEDSIIVEGPGGLYMKRTISPDGMTIHADEFQIGDYSGASGTEVVAQMVAQARLHGFVSIETFAAGEWGDSYNGYYTWPLIGYDLDIDKLKGKDGIRRAFPGAETVQDIFERPGGRDWWYMNGEEMWDAQFDLTDGSRSMKVLEAYMNEKRRK